MLVKLSPFQKRNQKKKEIISLLKKKENKLEIISLSKRNKMGKTTLTTTHNEIKSMLLTSQLGNATRVMGKWIIHKVG